MVLRAATFLSSAARRLAHFLITPHLCTDTLLIPRWINDENPLERAAVTASRHGFATPLDEIDAAARILDPVFAPLIDAAEGRPCRPMYGCFLKDFFSVEW